MSPPMNTLEDRLRDWVSDWLTKQRLATTFQVDALAGDGSPRPFFRIRIPGKSFVLLSEPAWTLSKDYPAHQAYLEREGVPVPAFLAVDEKLGALLMEDLGDTLLQHHLLAHPQEKSAWLQEATRLIARLHGATFPVPSELPVAGRSFDTQKYSDEMAFTFEHLHVGLFRLPPPDAALLKSVRTYCETLAGYRPIVFCHRDYHTRNLLVHEGRLRLIDFQDARLGSPEYDLASLFFDAYVPIDAAERTTLLALYRRVLSAFPLGEQIDWDGFEARLDRVALQRVVKAAGSFASFFTRYGKRTHLPYLVPALETAHALTKKIGPSAPAFPLDRWIEKAKEVAT